jgi:hypothetical protein
MDHLHVWILVYILPLVAFAQLLLFLDTDVMQVDPGGFQDLVFLQIEMHLLYVPLVQHEGPRRVKLAQVVQDPHVLLPKGLVVLADLDLSLHTLQSVHVPTEAEEGINFT